MKFLCGLTTLASCILLMSCANKTNNVAGHPSGTGPFDSSGNYIEAWADSPDKWSRANRRPSPITPKPKPTAPPVIATADLPPPDSVPIVVAQATPTPKPVTTTYRPQPKPVSTQPKPATTKPKPVTVKAKPKPKPTPPAATRYVVKKGDTLYAIAARNKTSVSALQRANGISGSIIRPGQTLKIPR